MTVKILDALDHEREQTATIYLGTDDTAAFLNWVIVGAQATSTTVVTITFATAPAGAVTYRVVVIG